MRGFSKKIIIGERFAGSRFRTLKQCYATFKAKSSYIERGRQQWSSVPLAA